ncbi:pentapeptide repeat-containing protein [Ekhidna sp.]|uniref:pentapeptide repeat-containing protein n=1 Tax=Ekhidna sp. TaxID=2608089 RepID=UPI003B505488
MEISASQSTKIRVAILLLFSLFVMRAFAQDRVQASQIIEDIREGKEITYSNVIVTGDLDFTYMEDKLPDLPKKSKWWDGGNGNTLEESIDVRISFTNCIFENDVLAYIHEDESGYTFIADFDKDVVFSNCEFKRNAMFKYSDFDGKADFSGSKFLRETTFKYAEFDEMADFSNTLFDDDATFKYAEFDEGVSFRSALFEESWNIKYMKARGDFDIQNIEVKDDIDAKYTKINGDSFTKYMLNSKN